MHGVDMRLPFSVPTFPVIGCDPFDSRVLHGTVHVHFVFIYLRINNSINTYEIDMLDFMLHTRFDWAPPIRRKCS